MKINISIDDRLLAKTDLLADANYTSRSGMISLALQQYIKQEDIILTFKELLVVMSKIEKDGFTEIEAEQLRDLEKTLKMLNK